MNKQNKNKLLKFFNLLTFQIMKYDKTFTGDLENTEQALG